MKIPAIMHGNSREYEPTSNLPVASRPVGRSQNGSARTRSDTDAAHMRKALGPGVDMQIRQTRQMQTDENANQMCVLETERTRLPQLKFAI